MALLFHAFSLLQYGNPFFADAFCSERLKNENKGWVYGTLIFNIDSNVLIRRATPANG
ncbi:MAG: hypothetical protein ACI8O8_001283 [Oleiphilaceae bacterium]|jgi:hypothetical protein